MKIQERTLQSEETETAGPKVGETLVPMDLNSGEHGDEAREGQKL